MNRTALLILPLFLLLPWGDGAMAADHLLAVQLWLLMVCCLWRDDAAPGNSTTMVGAALAGVALVGAARVTHQVDPYGGWLQLINYLFFGLFYLLVARACRTHQRWAGLAGHWLLAGILLAAGHGLAEQLLHHPGRVSGPFRDPNHLASLLVAGAALVLARLVFAGAGIGWRRRAWWLLPLLPLVWVLLLTGSRGGVLALMTVLTAALLARRLVLLLVPLAAGAGLLLIPNPFLTYLRNMATSDPYALERIGIWRSALAMIADNPLGVGLGNYRLFSAIYNFPVEHAVARFGRMPRQAHNMVLQLVAEGGLLMIVPLAMLAAALAAALWRYRRQRRSGGDDPLAAGALLGLLGLLVQAMVSKNLGNNALCFTMLFFCAVVSPLSPGIGIRLPAIRRPLVWAVGAVILWCAIWVPWHGHRLALAGQHKRAIAAVPIQSYYQARLAGLHGRQFLGSGNLEVLADAVELYDRAIRLNPRETVFRLQRSQLFHQLAQQAGHPGAAAAQLEAEQGYRSVLQLNPYDVAARFTLATICLDRGDRPAAIHQLEQAVDHEPNFIRGRLLLADLLVETGRTSEAGEQQREAQELQRRYAEPLPGWGPYERELLRSSLAPGLSIGKGTVNK